MFYKLKKSTVEAIAVILRERFMILLSKTWTERLRLCCSIKAVADMFPLMFQSLSFHLIQRGNIKLCPFTRYHRLKLPHNAISPNELTGLFDQITLLSVGRRST